jgi:choline dehydrogenase-like flavoprotein
MLLDARSLSYGEELTCDVCVVGAGAAGITLARELAGKQVSVCVLEAGGLEYDPATQALYEGDVVGHGYFSLDSCRVRIFGGTTTHWNGWCRPLDEVDLRRRDWVPDSGWPLERTELDTYYARAHQLCGLGPYDYSLPEWERAGGARALPIPRDRVASALYQFSPPTRFGVAYRDELRRASGVHVLLRANAVRVQLDPEGRRVSGVAARTLEGKRIVVRGRRTVLAAGGIESARLLLASNDVRPNGIGNQHDLVGRYFSDHPHAPAGLLGLPKRVSTAFYEQRAGIRGATVRGALVLPDRLEASERLLRSSFTFEPLERDPYVDRESAAEQRAERTGEDVLELAHAVDERSDTTLYALYMRAEQAPNPDSRVTLGRELDRLGMPKVRLRWRIGELDRRSAVRSVRALARAFGSSGLGRLYSRPLEEDGFWDHVQGGNHHLGTARMHAEARKGVVGRDCRVHGVDNLYVAGSAVFPTFGFANPTLTIVALAVRLADHLAGRIG